MSVNPGASVPDQSGHFGPYGGRFIPETLSAALDQLTAEYGAAQADPAFWGEFEGLLRDFVGRPTSIYRATHLEALWGDAGLLEAGGPGRTPARTRSTTPSARRCWRRMGKRRVIAETGAGQHGVATATACALLGLDCLIYMG